MSLKVKLAIHKQLNKIYFKYPHTESPIQVILWRKNHNTFSCLLYANYQNDVLQHFKMRF